MIGLDLANKTYEPSILTNHERKLQPRPCILTLKCLYLKIHAANEEQGKVLILPRFGTKAISIYRSIAKLVYIANRNLEGYQYKTLATRALLVDLLCLSFKVIFIVGRSPLYFSYDL